MGDILSGFCFLSILLLIITFLGHGIWVAVAAILQSLNAEPANSSGGAPSRPPRPPCIACGAVPADGEQRCRSCGAALAFSSQEPNPDKVLADFARQLQHLRDRELITAETYVRLSDVIRTEQSQLAAARLASQPPAGPASKQVRPDRAKDVAQPQGLPAAMALQVNLVPSQSSPSALSSDAMPPQHGVAPLAKPHPLDEPELPAREPAIVRKPRRTWGEIFASFMEERHLRWGELIGGLMIVCGSIALVLSFWGEIAQRPFLKFFVFNGVTAGLFGLGFYADRRMKLPNTAQGVLMISSLLVPLNFLALAAFSQAEVGFNLITLAGEAVSIVVFCLLLRAAGPTITGRAPWGLTIGVLGPSVATLLMRRFIGPASGNFVLLAMSSMPLAFYVLAAAWLHWRSRSETEISEPLANEHFRLLGMTTFAVLLPLGLLAYRTQDVAGALQAMAPAAAIAAAPALALGLRIWRTATKPELAVVRTAATAIATAGAGILLLGIAAAWPNPASIVPAALIAAVVLSSLAVAFKFPAMQSLVAAALTFAGVLLFHIARGTIAWSAADSPSLLSALFVGKSGWALAVMAIPLLAIAGIWHYLKRKSESVTFARAAMVSVGLSIVFVTANGWGRPGDPLGAIWFLGGSAIALMIGTVIREQRISGTGIRQRAQTHALVWVAAVLAWGSIAQAIIFWPGRNWLQAQPWLLTFLVHASIMCGLAIAASWKRRGTSDATTTDNSPPKLLTLNLNSIAWPLLQAASVSSRIGACLFVLAIDPVSNTMLAWFAAWIALLWLAISLTSRSAAWFTAFQSAATVGLVFATAAAIESTSWAAEVGNRWLDPWSLQWFGPVLAVWSTAWLALAIFLRRRMTSGEAGARTTQLQQLVRPNWPAVDQILRVCVLATAVGLAIYAALPGASQELTPRRLAATLEHRSDLELRIVPDVKHFELAALPHAHAAGLGGWLLLAAATFPWFVSQWENRRSSNLLAILLAASAACPLLAAMFESDVAVASAWRWLAAAFFLIASCGIWWRSAIAGWGTRLGWTASAESTLERNAKQATRFVLILAILPLASMLAYVALAAVTDAPLDATVRTAMPFASLGLLVGTLVCVILHFRGQTTATKSADAWRAILSRLAVILGAAPLIVLCMYAVTMALRGNPIAEPQPGTFFHTIGRAVSYAVPVLLGAITLAGFAIRERSAKFAFAAGLLFNASATAGYLLVAAKGGRPLDAEMWNRLAQLNAIVSGLFVLAWAFGLRWAARGRQADDDLATEELNTGAGRHGLLATTTLFAIALLCIPFTFGLVTLILKPATSTTIAALAGPWGWSMLGVVALASIVCAKQMGHGLGSKGLSLGFIALAVMAVFQIARYDTGNWLAYHYLLMSLSASGWFVLIAAVWRHRRETDTESRPARLASSVEWGTSIPAAVAIFLALREAISFVHPWWSVVSLCSVAALATALGFARLRRWPAFAAATILAIAVSLTWWQLARSGYAFVGQGFVDLANWVIVLQGMLCVVWVALERLITSRDTGVATERTHAVGCHRVVAAMCLIAVSLQVALQLAAEFAFPNSFISWTASTTIQWSAIVATAIGCFACLWDKRNKLAVIQLYVLGLTIAAMTLAQYPLSPRMMLWMGTIVLSAYTVLTSYLWSRRSGLRQFAQRLSIPCDDENELAGQVWLVPFNGVLIAIVIALAFVNVLSLEDQAYRLAVGQAAVLQALAIGMLARGARRSQLQLATLLTAALGCVVWGWAWLAPPQGGPFLNHGVVVAIVMAALTALYGLGLAKFFPRQTEWTSAAARLVPTLAAATIGTLLLILGAEASYFLAGDAIPIAMPGIITVAFSLVLLFAAAIIAAIVPGRDPLGLSERGRMLYVYAAEGLLALLFVHVRLTMPWLFQGFLAQFWPLIIVAIAFAGVGLAEIFRRQKRSVLAEPLERTSALLPLLPALGFWLAPQGHYSLVLLSVGAVYATLALMRRSFLFGVMAALAANGGLWYYLAGINGLEFWRHPQVWMIPISLCVLAAAYLNRKQLSEGQMTSIRYLTSSTIYLSSTADIFLNGVAQAPWLPLVLAAISVAGVLGGMLLRVRAFLFLGTSFLFLSLSTIIWYAAVDLHQTWLLWLTVVAAGIAILGLFALFEKKRNEVLRVISGLRKWSA